MSADLPEGVSIPDVYEHARNLSLAANMITLAGAYLTSDEGTEAEARAEEEWSSLLDNVLASGPELAGGLILALASVITQTGDQERVQAWFDEQAEHVKQALSREGSADG